MVYLWTSFIPIGIVTAILVFNVFYFFSKNKAKNHMR